MVADEDRGAAVRGATLDHDHERRHIAGRFDGVSLSFGATFQL